MPATAGRVRMPANNRVHSSAALQTHGIWQSVIGYDPYAPENNNNKHLQAPSSVSVSADAPAAPSNEAIAASSVKNAYTSLQGLLEIARITSNPDEARGACKKCGRVGHLTFQCRNFLSMKTISSEDDILHASSNEAEAQAKFAEAKNKASDPDEEGSEEDDIDSDSSDSDIDPMLEKIIAERQRAKSLQGKQSEENNNKTSSHRSGSTKDKKKDRRNKHESSDQDSESDSDRKRHMKDRKRHMKDRKRRRTHRRKDDKSGGEGKMHRHHHKRRRNAAPDRDSAADRS